MKINTSHLVGAVIVLAAVFFSRLDVQSTPAPVKVELQKWEYKHKAVPEVILADTEQWSSSDDYGRGGWEVASAYYDSKRQLHYFIWKRPVQ